MKKIVHLVVDDKFIDTAIRDFETIEPGRHEYVTVAEHPPWRYLRSEDIVSLDAAGWVRRVAADDVAAVVLHGLPAHHHALLQAIPAGPVVTWLGWGYDYYGLLADAFPDGLLLPQTAALVARLARPTADREPTWLAHARPCPKPDATQRAALRRVDLFSPVLSNEYRMLRRLHPWFVARYVRWNYGNAEDDLGSAPDAIREPGPDLLVGNSATPANNHLELFELIRQRVDLGERRLVVPLSYGDAAYREHVLAAGHRLFGQAFVPLVDFMPKARYLEMLGSCGFALMNHIRQQAMANICMAGLMGARVFLNRRNPAYRWLHQEGMPVEDLDDLQLQPLGPAQRWRQIEALRRSVGRSVQLERTRALLQAMLEPLASREPAVP